MSRSRLDITLVNRGYVDSRSKAQELIRNGYVKVNGKVITKTSHKVTPLDIIEITKEDIYVSRAAEKLIKAIETFGINLDGWICLDVGSSTGGFTQVMLEYGAKKVYAIDVGTDQMHPSLREDERVILYEQTDARTINKDLIPDPIDFFAMDVSFISVAKILPAIKRVIKEISTGVILIKPQFELSPQEVKKGIVRDPFLHIKAIQNVRNALKINKFNFIDLTFSPILGGDGNLEFLAYVVYTNDVIRYLISDRIIQEVVEQAHSQLLNKSQN